VPGARPLALASSEPGVLAAGAAAPFFFFLYFFFFFIYFFQINIVNIY
jgi:hypothetical protein